MRRITKPVCWAESMTINKHIFVLIFVERNKVHDGIIFKFTFPFGLTLQKSLYYARRASLSHCLLFSMKLDMMTSRHNDTDNYFLLRCFLPTVLPLRVIFEIIFNFRTFNYTSKLNFNKNHNKKVKTKQENDEKGF